MFEFVIVNHTEDPGDKRRQRRIRQHAIRQGLQSKRDELVARSDNFRVVQIDAKTGKPKRRRSQGVKPPHVKEVSASKLDPFDSLPGSGEHLRMLMQHRCAKKNGERVSCVASAGQVYTNGMDNVLKAALSDQDMFSDLSLALTVSTSANIPTIDCLTHRGAMLRELRTRLDEPSLLPSVSTLTAMLLLIGYEYRVEGSSAKSINMHLRAVQDILRLNGAGKVAVSDIIRRALLWLDLYCCMFFDSPRLLPHEEYTESNDKLDLTLAPGHSVPVGFHSVVEAWHPGYGDILKDVNALCYILDSHSRTGKPPFKNFPIEHFQYGIESRLVNLLDQLRRSVSVDPIYEACIFATFLCTYKIFVGVWDGCFIPDYCASQILGLISQAKDDPRWQQWRGLLLWMLFVAGILALKRTVKARAAVTVQDLFQEQLNGMYESAEQLRANLKMFIWSSHAMERESEQFWEELEEQLDFGNHQKRFRLKVEPA